MWKHLVKISLALLNVKTLSENSKFTTFNQMNVSLDRSKLLRKLKKKKLFGWLDWFSIPIRSIKKANSINQKEFSIGRKLNKFITKSRVDSIDSWFLFDRSKRNIRLIEGNSRLFETHEIEFSRIFTKQFSTVFHEQTTIIWT